MFPEVMHEFDPKNYPSKDKIILKEIKFTIYIIILDMEIILKDIMQKSHSLLVLLHTNSTDKLSLKKRDKNLNNLFTL